MKTIIPTVYCPLPIAYHIYIYIQILLTVYAFLPGRSPRHWISPWEKSEVAHVSQGEIQHIGFLPGRNPKLCISPREKSNTLDLSLGEIQSCAFYIHDVKIRRTCT